MPTRRPYSRARQARHPRSGRSCLAGLVFLLVVLIGGGALLFVEGYLPPVEVSRHALPSPRPYEQGALAAFFTSPVRYWGWQIEAWAGERGIDPNLVATVMQIESCGDPEARSDVGAAGLFQVMPFHFEPGEDALEPQVNALRGLDYLVTVLQAAGEDVYLALAGYNGGMSVLSQPADAWPAETRRFAAWGQGIYADALAGAPESAALNDWLSQGGKRLCRRAEQRLGIGAFSQWVIGPLRRWLME